MHRAIGAAAVLVVLVGATGYGLWTLRDDAIAVVDELPRAAAEMRQSLRQQREPSAIDKLQEAAKEIDKTAAAAAGPTTPDPGGVQRVQIVQPFRATDYLTYGSMGALAVGSQAVMIVFLSYFLLVSDDLFKRKLVKIMPTLSKKKITVEIVEEIGTQIERFLMVQVFTSVLVAVATSLALWWLGLEQAVIWGILAGILNSVPYFGPLVVTGGLMVVAYLQFRAFDMTSLRGRHRAGDHDARRVAAHADAHGQGGEHQPGRGLRRDHLLELGVGRLGPDSRGADADDGQGGLRPDRRASADRRVARRIKPRVRRHALSVRPSLSNY